MSQRNSKTAKAAARERLRLQREKDAKRAKIRRQAFVGGGVVLVLAIAGGVAFAVNEMNKPSHWEHAADAKLVAPPSTTGKDHAVVVIGDPKNKNVLTEYEDLRCPICAGYEQAAGAAVLQGAKDGKYRIEYHFATFIDDMQGGQGSKKALSALGAALNVSVDAFEQFHTALYTKANHPDEKEDVYGSDANLFKIADQVPALKGNAKFRNAVTKGTYDKWATVVTDAYNKDQYSTKGTPYVLVNGTPVSVTGQTSEAVTGLIAQHLKK